MKTGITPIDIILTEAEPFILKVLSSYEKFYYEHGWLWTTRSAYLTRLEIIYKMVSSLSKNLADTDVVSEVNLGTGNSGDVVISCNVHRDDVKYRYVTEVISAGGYNIQCEHYRYLIHTTLPKSNSQTAAKIISDRIKKLKKEDRIQEDIDRVEKYIADSNQTLISLNAMTESEVWDKSGNEKFRAYNPDNTFFTSREHFDQWFNEIVEDTYKRHHRNIQMTKDRIVFLQKEIEKHRARKAKL